MKWIGISGNWRKTNRKIEERLKSVVAEILKEGNGIVSGGALGVVKKVSGTFYPKNR